MATVRHATSSDVERIYELIVAIADHHHQSEFVRTNPAQLMAAGFADDPKYGVLVAEHEASIVGYVSYTINYSIWLGCDYMNIDDVFVDSNYRGQGTGEALMQETARHCRREGVSRIRWEVQSENHAAIRFYKRLGAKLVEKGVFSWDLLQ